MSENTRRPLRNNRRPPNYLSSEVAMLGLQQQEGEATVSMRHSNVKESKPTTLSSNAMAKILNKFIRQINLRYEETLKSRALNNPGIQKKQFSKLQSKNAKVERLEKQVTKHFQKDTRTNQDEAYKMNKQVYNFKAQHWLNHPQKGSLDSGQEKFLTREAMAANAQENALNMISRQYYPLLNSMPNAKNQHLNLSEQIQQRAQTQQFQAPKSQLFKHSKHPFESNVRHGSKTSGILASDAKLFKRASYHVAIAYHIYIKNFKSRGKQLINANDIDPTYLARKIKQESMSLTQKTGQQKKKGKSLDFKCESEPAVEKRAQKCDKSDIKREQEQSQQLIQHEKRQ